MHPMVIAIKGDLEKLADPAKAAEMQAYMKTGQPSYGVQAGSGPDAPKISIDINMGPGSVELRNP